MAASKCYSARQSHRFLTGDEQQFHGGVTAGSDFELDEWDLHNLGHSRSDSAGFKNITISGRVKKNKSSSGKKPAAEIAGSTPSSLPVNVPNWSKILGEVQRCNPARYDDVEENGDDVDGLGDSLASGGGRRVPPHEFLAGKRMASFSVHEGVGRTLKGRDLSRVRNAIFEITGFQD